MNGEDELLAMNALPMKNNDNRYNWIVIVLGFVIMSLFGLTWSLINNRVGSLEEWRKSAQQDIRSNKDSISDLQRQADKDEKRK